MNRRNRLLFLAMSGVRVRNEELLAVGLTLPGFVERSQVIASLPSLSLLTLAALTPASWEVHYEDIDALTVQRRAALLASAYDVVAISSLTARILETYELADELRAQGVTVILGGLHVSALPEEAMGHADAVVQGEGEAVWPTVLHDLACGQLQPLYRARHRSGPGFLLQNAPVPRYDLLDVTKYNRIPLQTTRGCPLTCHFCAASRTISQFKTKPIDRVRAELAAICAQWPKPFLELADDNTFVDKAWSRQLVDTLAEFPVRWFTETDLSVADDDALLGRLANSGCVQLLIGLESVNPRSLLHVDGRHWKYGRLASYREKIAYIQSYGISVNGCFVFGFDQDTPDVFERTRDFILESALSEVQITILTPFPGTALHRRLAREGRLLRPVYWDQCTLFDVTFRPARMTVTELETGFRTLMQEVYAPSVVAKRKRHFRACVQARRRLENRMGERTR